MWILKWLFVSVVHVSPSSCVHFIHGKSKLITMSLLIPRFQNIPYFFKMSPGLKHNWLMWIFISKIKHHTFLILFHIKCAWKSFHSFQPCLKVDKMIFLQTPFQKKKNILKRLGQVLLSHPNLSPAASCFQWLCSWRCSFIKTAAVNLVDWT